MKLSACRESDCVTVVRVGGSGTLRKRLLEMGFIKGTSAKIVRYAPLKDPIEVVVKNYHLSIRVSEADLIEVT
jgi:Fe2+ transport system protein FeoA